ncbi:MAG: molybdopterin cofactor-binding domain-containing protein, partial [Rhodothalassiaceae bacterium]
MSGAMTRDLDRRDFLKGSAGLAFAIGASGLVAACGKPGTGTNAALAPNIWLSIATDGTVTIQYPATEMGQGTMSALPLVLAEELDADWNRVRVETVRIHDTRYGNPIFGNILYTAGSATVEGYYDRMRKAGAQARRILIEAAAAHWKVPASRLVTEPGAVVDPETGARLDYGAIAAFARVPDPLPEIGEADYKPRERYRLVGRDTPRIDIPAKARGTAEYGMDVALPGRVYGAVLRAPVEGERALEVDDGAARAIPSVTEIVPLDDGVGVVGTSVEAVFAARAALRVRRSTDSPFRQYDSESTLADYLDQARDLSQAGIRWRDEGDIDAAFEGAARVLEASYLSDYVYHAQMEPVAATARVSDTGNAAEIWVGSQTQSLTIL